MKNVTIQEVFDRVVSHLLTQKKPSYSAGGGCAYRGADGLMCAVGCLIPDNLYNPLMDTSDSTDIESVIKRFGMIDLFDFKVTDCSDDEFISLLDDLQSIHDAHPSSKWENELKLLATNHNLEFRDIINCS